MEMDHRSLSLASSSNPIVAFCGLVDEKSFIIDSLGVRGAKVVNINIDSRNVKQALVPLYDHVVIGKTCTSASADLATIYFVAYAKLARWSVSVVVPRDYNTVLNIQKQLCDLLSLHENCGILEERHISLSSSILTMDLGNARKKLAEPAVYMPPPPIVPMISDRRPLVYILCGADEKADLISEVLSHYSISNETHRVERVAQYSKIDNQADDERTLVVLKSDDTGLVTASLPFFTRIIFRYITSRIKENAERFYTKTFDRLFNGQCYELDHNTKTQRVYTRKKVAVYQHMVKGSKGPLVCPAQSPNDLRSLVSGILQSSPEITVVDEPQKSHFCVMYCFGKHVKDGITNSLLTTIKEPKNRARLILCSESKAAIEKTQIQDYEAVGSVRELTPEKGESKRYYKLLVLASKAPANFGVFV
jgi:hypothetical protein